MTDEEYVDPFEELAKQRVYKIRAHLRLMDSPEFEAAERQLNRLVLDFARAVSVASFYATRMPEPARDALVFARSDDFTESAFAILTAAREGLLRAARREQRYLLEAIVKYLATDQAKPELPLKKRIGYFEREIQKLSIAPGKDLSFPLLDRAKSHELRDALQPEYDRLSLYVHASAAQVRGRLAAAAKGCHLGFESVKEIEDLNSELSSFFDLCLALVFHALDPQLLGDLFVGVFDNDPVWSFNKTRFVAAISARFDYKAERQRGFDQGE